MLYCLHKAQWSYKVVGFNKFLKVKYERYCNPNSIRKLNSLVLFIEEFGKSVSCVTHHNINIAFSNSNSESVLLCLKLTTNKIQ